MNLVLNDTNPTLCLNMIVKNESKIIKRLFDSVVSIIDCYCICDTGSTDNTIEIITDYFASKNIPGKIVSEPFKNFCHNRNFALQSCIGMSDYLLLLDADMILEVKKFNKNLLQIASSFSILQGNDSFYYQNLRIIKNNGQYKYNGVTHEYIDTPSNNSIYNIEKDKLFIRDVGDGGSKQNKFERDISLLLDGIKDDPNNARYYFYLANSYHDCGRFEEAINFYKKRIELRGWNQEVWYSYYRIGLCFKNMGKIEEAIYYWLKGYNYYSERLENLYEIIQHYRITSQHKLAEIFYKEARKNLDLNKNRDSYLFLHEDIYSSKIYYEYTIIAAYLGIYDINYEVVKVLNYSRDKIEVNNMLSNMKFYKNKLNLSTKMIVDNTIQINIENEPTTFYSSSSCLIPTIKNGMVTGYKMNIRYVNYYIDSNGCYLYCDKYIISFNKYIEFDNQMNVTFEKMMELKFDNRRYIGVEDVRIFNDIKTNDLLFIGTGFHKSNQIGIVTGKYDIENCTMNYNEIIPNFNNSSCEKNWVFVNYKDSTHIVYDWFPLRICKINLDVNDLSLVEKKEMPFLFSYIRGSTSGFTYSTKNNEKEIWFVTHLVSYESPRHYYHLIVVFDNNMNLLRYSAPFKFEESPIEYCLSILVEQERVLINYSTWDRTTRIGVYDKKYIESILLEKV
jgi:tetratricopeptide (TPR) repeat protein